MPSIRKSFSRRFSFSAHRSSSSNDDVDNDNEDDNNDEWDELPVRRRSSLSFRRFSITGRQRSGVGSSNVGDDDDSDAENEHPPRGSMKFRRNSLSFFRSSSSGSLGSSSNKKKKNKRKSIREQRMEMEQETRDEYYDSNGLLYASDWHKVISKHDWIQLEEMIKRYREDIASQKSRRSYTTTTATTNGVGRSHSFDSTSTRRRPQRSASMSAISTSSSGKTKRPSSFNAPTATNNGGGGGVGGSLDGGWAITDDKGRTPLHLACMEGVPSELLQHLINLDSSSLSSSLFTQADYDGQYVIHAATKSLHITDEDLQLIIKLCPQSLLATDRKGQIPLLCAMATAREMNASYANDVGESKEDDNSPEGDNNSPFQAKYCYWGLQLSTQQCEWESYQEHRWKKVAVILNIMKSKRKAVPARDQPGLICQAMDVGAPVEVIELLITTCRPQQQNRIFETNLQMCAKAIGYIFVYNYPLSLLKKLLGAAAYDETDPPKKILGALRKGFMKHYKAGFEWKINLRNVPNYLTDKQKEQFSNQLLPLRSEVMRYYRENRQQIVQSGTAMTSHRAAVKTKVPLHPSCQNWWSMLKFLLLYTTTRDPSKLNSQHLLHVALSIPACPPSIIELIVAVHPFSRQKEDPRYPGALPVHIACQHWKHEKSQEDEYSVEEVLISKVIGNYDYHWAWRRYLDRIPIHHAIAKGKTWSFLEPLVRIDIRTLAVRDPVSKLYPFQLAASWYTLEMEERGFERCEAERQKTIMSEVKSRLTFPWQNLSPEEQTNVYSKVEKEQDLRQLTTIFELLKSYPVAIGHGAINTQNNPTSSAIANPTPTKDLVSAGIVSSYFLGWIYLRNKYTGEWKVAPERMEIINKTINSPMFYIVDIMRVWWNKLLDHVWQSYDGSLGRFQEKSAKYLIHCALVNVDTPPKVIGVLVKQFPKSLGEPIPGTSLYPIHIAAATSSTYIPQSFEVPEEKSVLDYIREGTPKHIFAENQSGGRIPLHIAIVSGKRLEEIRLLVRKDKDALLVRDPETQLLPFQLMALKQTKLSDDQQRRLINETKESLQKLTTTSVSGNDGRGVVANDNTSADDSDNDDNDDATASSPNVLSKKIFVHWSYLSTTQKSMMLWKQYEKFQSESLSCIYELLRAQPLALEMMKYSSHQFSGQPNNINKLDTLIDDADCFALENNVHGYDKPSPIVAESNDETILGSIHDGTSKPYIYVSKRLRFGRVLKGDGDGNGDDYSESSIASCHNIAKSFVITNDNDFSESPKDNCVSGRATGMMVKNDAIGGFVGVGSKGGASRFQVTDSQTVCRLPDDEGGTEQHRSLENHVRESEKPTKIVSKSNQCGSVILDSASKEDLELEHKTNDQSDNSSSSSDSSSSSSDSSSTSDDSIKSMNEKKLLARFPGVGDLFRRIDSQHKQVSHRLLVSHQTLSGSISQEVMLNSSKKATIASFHAQHVDELVVSKPNAIPNAHKSEHKRPTENTNGFCNPIDDKLGVESEHLGESVNTDAHNGSRECSDDANKFTKEDSPNLREPKEQRSSGAEGNFESTNRWNADEKRHFRAEESPEAIATEIKAESRRNPNAFNHIDVETKTSEFVGSIVDYSAWESAANRINMELEEASIDHDKESTLLGSHEHGKVESESKRVPTTTGIKHGNAPICENLSGRAGAESQLIAERNVTQEDADGFKEAEEAIESDVANEVDIWDTGSQGDANSCTENQDEDGLGFLEPIQETESDLEESPENQRNGSVSPGFENGKATEDFQQDRNSSRYKQRRVRHNLENATSPVDETRLVIEIRVENLGSCHTGRGTPSCKEISHNTSLKLGDQAAVVEHFERWRGLDTLLQRISDQHERVAKQLKKNRKSLERRASF